MEKLKFLFCAGAMALCLTACGKGKEDSNSQGMGQSGSINGEQGSSTSNSQDNTGASNSAGNGQGGTGASNSTGNGQGNMDDSNSSGLENVGEENQPEDGWSEEMAKIRAAVVEALGDDYWPNMPMDEEMFEMFIGVTPDMYDDYMAESPMISANVDTLVIVRAKEGMADTVEETLDTYRDGKVSDTMQYPMNIGKIQASQVVRMGDYVVFVQLGADPMGANDEDASNEDVMKKCREVNERVIEIIRQYVEP